LHAETLAGGSTLSKVEKAKKDPLSLTSGDPDRGTFVAYFLGGIVPLIGLGYMLGRFTDLRAGPLEAGLGWAPLDSSQLLGLFASIAALSLACFFLLRQLVRNSILQNRRLSQFDTLTGLPNRRLFKDRAEQALLRARRERALFALCFLDLDSFKRVNDTLGHEAGDRLLTEVSRRLQSLIRSTDTVTRLDEADEEIRVARLGGDEFTLLLTGIENAIDADRITRRVLEAFRAPFMIDDHELFVTVSIGTAIYPFDGEEIDTLLKNADTAMYHAKEEGRNNCKFFSNSMNEESARKLDLEERLRGAIASDALSIHFQPIRELESGRVVAAEALIRWQDSELGWIPPDEFIPVAEDSGLIDSIGDWVLATACRTAQDWVDRGFEPIRLSVNVSGHQVRKAEFVDKVRNVLDDSLFSPASLELEITESTIMQDDKQIDEAFECLHEMGIGLALDDFGTGYSSLTYLRRFPISRVKIDRSFVEGIPQDSENLALTAAIISMAHHLTMLVVGEGVETEDQAQSLRELGCEEIQGYLFSKPVSPDAFEPFLEVRKLD
jgi:diguanylate cyclase (GGDEF)-like protein